MRFGLLSVVGICCVGCASVSHVMGIEKAHILVTYYAPAWGPNEKGEEVVYFLKQVTMQSASDERNRIYFCSIKPDGSERKEIAWLWRDAPDQFFDNYATAATMEANAATKRAVIGVAWGGRGGVFVLGLDGKGLHRVWPKEWDSNRPTGASYPTWSPDGQWLAFEEQRNENGYDFRQISKFRPDGTGYTNLTQRNGWEINIQPTWSPTGELIAYVNDRIANPARNIHAVDLWLIKPDGGEKRDTKQWGRYPRWSPDGKLILLEGTWLIDAGTGMKVRTWHPFGIYPKWGKSGFVSVGPLDINISDPEGKTSRYILKNVSRKGSSSDTDQEAFRW